MNKFLITGRLCNDMEMVYTRDGKAIVKFSFAVDRRFKRDGESEADFFQCCAFGTTAEMLKKCEVAKGTKLLLDGEVRNNNYTDREGVKRYGTQLIVNSFEFCESKAAQSSRSGNVEQQNTLDDGFMHCDDSEELPFS